MKHTIVAICSSEECAKILKECGEKKDYTIKVEIQKDEIIKDEICDKDIKQATAILFAIDGEVEEINKIERFVDYEYYEVNPKFILKDGISVLNEIVTDIN